MFRRLRTKLTVLYAALFGVTLLLVSIAVFTAISEAAQRQVRGELTASGTVFDRLWSLREERLREGAALLSRDFGFREAVATRDQATIISAMENLRRRFGVDRAFIVGVDGKVTGGDAAAFIQDAPRLGAAFASADDPEGVAVLGGTSYQLISAPLMSPDLVGWVVFAVRLDGREMAALERLSAIPLQAAVLHRDARGWLPGAGAGQGAPSAFIEGALKRRSLAPQALDDAHGPSIALVKPLQTLAPNEAAVLVLRYPLALALAPFRSLLAMVALAGAAGLMVMSWGSWVLARGVTRPVSALDEAAHRLQRGEDAHVAVETADEIGRLAESFNTMATAIRDRERRITHLAMHDEDTGLPNRLALEQVVESFIQAPQGGGYVAALGIRRFDEMRGAIGYKLAAQAVRLIGDRLGSLPGTFGVARLSTDVLGFTLRARDRVEAEQAALMLMAELERPLQVGGAAIDVALMLGLAPIEAGTDARRTAELANKALDQARAGRRKVSFFDAEAYGDPSSNLSLMSSLLTALESGEVEVHYQPKYDLRRSAVAGAEALLRWRHPTRGMLSPDLFIPMAEDTGHIRTLTEWVVRRAVADQQAVAAAGHELPISINISGRTLGEQDFTEFALAQAAAAKGELCFEITETAVIENPELALEMLDAFAEAGIGISIDDFGTGLSSLAYLKRIRGQELKIDKSIVQGVTESQRDALIVRSTIDLAHSLGLKVTAEGVETESCCALLAAMGCDHAQGYLISKPLALKDLLVFLSHGDESRRQYG